MFAELRLVAPQPDRQESYGGKLARVMWKTFLASLLAAVDVVCINVHFWDPSTI